MTGARADVTTVVERFVARWAARDTAELSRLFADEVRWWTAPVPGAPWPAEVRKPREVESFFIAFLAVKTGLGLSYDFAMAFGVRGGQIAEFRLFTDTLAIARALGVD